MLPSPTEESQQPPLHAAGKHITHPLLVPLLLAPSQSRAHMYMSSMASCTSMASSGPRGSNKASSTGVLLCTT